jgi:hypothetical protein
LSSDLSSNEYVVYACDAVTGRILADLPVRPSTIGWTHNGAGSINDLTVPAQAFRGLRSYDVDLLMSPARTALYVDLNGSLIWGGPLWKTLYDSATRAYTLSSAGWWDYWMRLLITEPVAFRNVDQFDIVRTLLTLTTGQPGHIDLIMSTADSGVTRTASYEQSELRRVGEVIAQLSDNLNGFEFRVDVRWGSSGLPERVLQLGSPRLGQVQPAAGLILEYREDPDTLERSGNVASYQWPMDGTTMATETWGMAQTDSGTAITSAATSPALIAAGYPVLHQVLEGHDNVVLQATLDAYVLAQQQTAVAPQQIPSFVLDHAGDATIGQWLPGDDALVEITDLRFPSPDGLATGLRQWIRTVEASLDVAAEKLTVSVAQVDPTLPLPTSMRRPRQSHTITTLLRQVARVSRRLPSTAVGSVAPVYTSWPSVATAAWTAVGQSVLWRYSPTVTAVAFVHVPTGSTAQARLRIYAAPGAIGSGVTGLDVAGDFVDIAAGDAAVLVGVDAPDLWLVGWAVTAVVEVARSGGSGTINAVAARFDQR